MSCSSWALYLFVCVHANLEKFLILIYAKSRPYKCLILSNIELLKMVLVCNNLSNIGRINMMRIHIEN